MWLEYPARSQAWLRRMTGWIFPFDLIPRETKPRLGPAFHQQRCCANPESGTRVQPEGRTQVVGAGIWLGRLLVTGRT